MREWEKATWASGQTEQAVMRCAGEALARSAERLTRPGDFILTLAGKGHNGDDARFATEQMAGRQVHLCRVSDPELAVKEVETFLARRPALLIDGLFGIGLNRPLASTWLRLIRRINDSKRPVLAVDVPSGLNADTGEPLDEAVRAAHTLTFGAVKQGLLRSTAWPFVGRLEVAPEIGLIPYPFTTEINWTMPTDFLDFPPARPVHSHKGTLGHLVILGGSMGYHGASVLAARGAQRARPGLISLFTAPEVYSVVAGQLQAVMVHPCATKLELPGSCTAVLAGPGLASPQLPEWWRSFVGQLWLTAPQAVVVDASALDWLPPGPCQSKGLRVITPHPGEAARLLKTTSAEVQANRPQAVRELSRRWGECHVVLKGHQTLIGRGKEALYVNSTGNPLLAQGGSGDLLAGYLAGWLAQPDVQPLATLAIRCAVWQHGAAADALARPRSNWTVEDLAGTLGTVHS
jgi:NAD(P)H-hydrate epimerase